jgi:hypothetical protein
VYGHPCKHANRTGDASDASDAPDDDAKLDEYTRNTPPFVISPFPSIRTSSARSKHSFQLLASVDKVAFAFASPASSSSSSSSLLTTVLVLVLGGKPQVVGLVVVQSPVVVSPSFTAPNLDAPVLGVGFPRIIIIIILSSSCPLTARRFVVVVVVAETPAQGAAVHIGFASFVVVVTLSRSSSSSPMYVRSKDG